MSEVIRCDGCGAITEDASLAPPNWVKVEQIGMRIVGPHGVKGHYCSLPCLVLISKGTPFDREPTEHTLSERWAAHIARYVARWEAVGE